MQILTLATDTSRAGVSTTVISLAECLSAQGFKVLVVDLASDITRCLLPHQPSKTLWDLYLLTGLQVADIVVSYHGYDILPITRSGRLAINHLFLDAVEPGCPNGCPQAYILRGILKSKAVQNRYDVCIIDVDRSSGCLVDQAIYAADTVLIPLKNNLFSFGAATIIDKTFVASLHAERSINVEAFCIQPTPWVSTSPPRDNKLIEYCITNVSHLYRTKIGYTRYADRILQGNFACQYLRFYTEIMSLATELVERHNLVPKDDNGV